MVLAYKEFAICFEIILDIYHLQELFENINNNLRDMHIHMYFGRIIKQEVASKKGRVRKGLQKYKYCPYKPQCHENIFDIDEERRRSAFCCKVQECTNNDRGFLLSVYFTDEYTFDLNTEPNIQNTFFSGKPAYVACFD